MFNKARIKHLIESATDISYGIYNGTVVDVDDKGINSSGRPMGRIRVEIPHLTKGLPKDHLPWYIGKHSFNSSPDSQSKIPPLGSEVVVEFPTNDIYNGFYSYVIISSPPD